MDLNTEIYARFLGLYLMKMDIPSDILEWVSTHKAPNNDIDITMIAKMLSGAPNTKDDILRETIKSIL